MPIDWLCIRLNQQSSSIRTHDISLHTTDLRPTGSRHIEKHAGLLSGLKRIGQDTFPVFADLSIRFSIGHRIDFCHRLRTELATRYISQTQFVTSL